MLGPLHGFGIHVPQGIVHESLLRINPRLVELRSSTIVVRRTYNVASSHALWHIDGLHYLIRWRIVIHGDIDGYSRRIVYLHVSNNNRAVTYQDLASTIKESNVSGVAPSHVCATLSTTYFMKWKKGGLLSPTDDKHLFCIHHIFLPRINLQLQQFMVGWNNHSLRTESTNGIMEKRLVSC